MRIQLALATVCFSSMLFSFGAETARAVTFSINSVRTYDEQIIQSNTVDATAPGSIDVGVFTTAVATAWDNDLGGVIDFEAPAQVFLIDQIDAAFGTSGTKTLSLLGGQTLTTGGTHFWELGNSTKRTEISGELHFAKDNSGSTDFESNDFIFDIGPITGGLPGEQVVKMGLTVLSRGSSSRATGEVSVIGTFNDGSTLTLTDDVIGDAGEDDTFYGIAAPAGLYFTRLHVVMTDEILDNDGNVRTFTSIDDFGFTTAVIAVGQTGDFDGDLDVDGADFLIWQRDLGDAANLVDWEDNFGTVPAVSAVSAVPEPTSLLVACTIAMATLAVRRCRRLGVA